MTATTIEMSGRHPRPLLPLANLALAGAALTVSLIAITTDNQAPAAPTASSSAGGSATGDCFARDVIVRC